MSKAYLAEHKSLLIGEKGNQIKSTQIKSSRMLVFGERGKPEYPGKNLSQQIREPTNSTHICFQIRESNPGHINGMRVLPPLRHHSANTAPTLLPKRSLVGALCSCRYEFCLLVFNLISHSFGALTLAISS